MPGGGSSIFTDPDRYLACLPLMAEFAFVDASRFIARLTWVELPHMGVFRMRETAPRVGYIGLPSNMVFVTFPVRGASPLIVGGKELHHGELVLHARGERFHQRMTAAGQWGGISLQSLSFESGARTLTGQAINLPEFRKVVRPGVQDRNRLLRLHAEACRIAETAVSNLGQPEVARALEQDLLWVLVTCLTESEVRGEEPGIREAAEALLRCEEVLAATTGSSTLDDVCRFLGMTERELGAFSSEILGMSPDRYFRLKRIAPAKEPGPTVPTGNVGRAREQ